MCFILKFNVCIAAPDIRIRIRRLIITIQIPQTCISLITPITSNIEERTARNALTATK